MPAISPEWQRPETTPIDFLIVGAGAGGAPLAARLAERGYTVLLAEMGPERPPKPADAAVENTDVPLLHPEVTEDPRHSLRFFVKHFDTDPGSSTDPGRSSDPKYHTPQPGTPTPHPDDEYGLFYPRAQGVGGCTIHNAMITVAGPSEDWDQIAEATGDESWRGERMRSYFERMERCHYNRPSLAGRIRRFFGLSTGWEGDRHGTRGWLNTTLADLRLVLEDPRLLKVVLGAAYGAVRTGVENLGQFLRAVATGQTFPSLDPNNWNTMRSTAEGLVRIPTAISPDGTRSSPRERLLGVKAHPKHGARLHLLTGVCVTGIEFADAAAPAVVGGAKTNLRAVGVRVLPQEHVYEADPAARGVDPNWQSREEKVFCRREVILCGGTFNTPQLLMLSGIGPTAHLSEHGIMTRVDVPGVGENLQDRYEVPVVATVTGQFDSLNQLGSTSRDPVASKDPHLTRWRDGARQSAADRGLYATNGGLIAILKRSSQEDSVPDLFIFALPGYFPGYHVGYSRPAAFCRLLTPAEAARPQTPAERTAEDERAQATPKRLVTWLLLKARTHQHRGEVRLRSTSPFRRPAINFRSFPMGDADPDALALAEGVKFVRGFLESGREAGLVEKYDCPGLADADVPTGLVPWVRHTAWGHHACGTCRIGRDADAHAVLDSRFRVRGVQGLRVADASVFPRIPGVFIVSNVYMIAEKAADVLTEDHPLSAAAIPPECREALALDPVMRSRAGYEARRVYPVELEAAEAELICRRRRAAALPPPPTSNSKGPP